MTSSLIISAIKKSKMAGKLPEIAIFYQTGNVIRCFMPIRSVYGIELCQVTMFSTKRIWIT